MSNPLSPLEAPFPDEVADVLASYPHQDGYILSLFRTFANSLRFLKKGVPNLLDRDSPLDLRTREIVILRTTANRNCEYEWGVHVAIFARAAKLTAPQIAASRTSERAFWSDKERVLIDAIDQLCTSGNLQEETTAQFQSLWTVEQQLEILALIGTYSTISYVANIAKLAPEPFAARFPAAT